MINKAVEIFDTVLAEEKELIAMPMGSIKKTVEDIKMNSRGKLERDTPYGDLPSELEDGDDD